MTKDNSHLIEFAKNVRIDILKMVHNAKSGHIGGSFSCTDILTILYNEILNIPKKWDNDLNFRNRDRFILSKGHASPALYGVLAEYGMFDKNELMTFRKLGSRLQGHPSLCTHLPGIEVSTGSLGQGLSMGVGIALALRLDKIKSKVFVLMGDGEVQEGSVWEALMNATHQKLDNIVVIIDKNNLQIDGKTSDVKNIDPLDKKLLAFNWSVKTVDGHNFDELRDALNEAKNAKTPFAIIANTIKGKGISFMENNHKWHGKAPNDEEFKVGMEELSRV